MEHEALQTQPTTAALLRELEAQLDAAAESLARPAPAVDQARSSVVRAREVLALLQAQSDAPDDGMPPRTGDGLALVRQVQLPAQRASARRARAFATETCARWDLPASVRNAAVDIASELVSNAAAHGSGPVVLALERGAGNLLVRAWDDGPGAPRVLPYRPGVSEKGLGLRLVKQLSTHWGAAADEGGKWVWARIALPGPDSA